MDTLILGVVPEEGVLLGRPSKYPRRAGTGPPAGLTRVGPAEVGGQPSELLLWLWGR